MVKKDGVSIVKKPHLQKMLPPSYQICFQRQLKNTEYLTLTILVFLLQTHKQVSIEALATLMPYPILFESRRRGIQRFLKLPILKIERLWFPLVIVVLNKSETLNTTIITNNLIQRCAYRCIHSGPL